MKGDSRDGQKRAGNTSLANYTFTQNKKGVRYLLISCLLRFLFLFMIPLVTVNSSKFGTAFMNTTHVTLREKGKFVYDITEPKMLLTRSTRPPNPVFPLCLDVNNTHLLSVSSPSTQHHLPTFPSLCMMPVSASLHISCQWCFFFNSSFIFNVSTIDALHFIHEHEDLFFGLFF